MIQRPSRLIESLRLSFSLHPTNCAVSAGDRSWTYRDLDRISGGLATTMGRMGVCAESVVALLLPRSISLVAAQVATIRLGATYAPLDPRTPTAQFTKVLQDLKPAVLLSDGDLPPLHRQLLSDLNIPVLDVAACLGIDESAGIIDWANSADDAAAYVMFTSGSTATPKGVMIPHSGIARLVRDADYARFDSTMRAGFVSAPWFDASTLEVWAPLLNGGCCFILDATQPSLDELAEFLRNHRITHTFLTSALFSAVVDLRPECLAGLSELIVGGERVSPQHARQMLREHPHVRLINGYGPTENTTFTTAHPITLDDCENPRGIPIGRPIRGTDTMIGTAARGATQGELLVTGEGLALGYLNDAQLTSTKFIHLDGKRWYCTGDIVSCDAGDLLHYVGRADRQVKLQGHRIELDGIEIVLGGLSGIGQCSVVVRGSRAADRHLVGFYTVLPGSSLSQNDILTWLESQLPPYSVPRVLRQVRFMPRTATGKIDTARLAIETLPEAAVMQTGISACLLTGTEAELADVWGSIFSHTTIGAASDFHELGGTSLQALELSARVAEHFDKDFGPADILRYPQLGQQAAFIGRLHAGRKRVRENTDVTRVALTPTQRSILAASRLDRSACAFHVHAALVFEEPVDLHLFRDAFAQLISRHAMLRAQFTNSCDSYARISAALPVDWWSTQETSEALITGSTVAPHVLAHISRPIDLTQGVTRVDCWHSPTRTLVVWTTHHVSIDEASLDLVLDELGLALRGEVLPPVALAISRLSHFAATHVDRHAVQYWPARIAEVAQSPAALPDSLAVGRDTLLQIPATVGRAFLQLCRTLSVTPFAPLLTCYSRAIQSVFGSDHAFVVTPFSRGEAAGCAGMVGCHIDLNVIEAGARKDESMPTHLHRIRRMVSKAQRASFFPFDDVAESLSRMGSGLEKHLRDFAFTWRLQPFRKLTFGSHAGRLLRIPQQGNRFGLTLHAWTEGDELHCSVEHAEDESTATRVAEVGREFVRNLETLATADADTLLHATTTHDLNAHMPLSVTSADERARTEWQQATGVGARDIVDASVFWEHGGTSLSAMRMLSSLAHSTRTKMDVAEFFMHPTFGTLQRLLSQADSESAATHIVFGDPNAENVLLMFPGNHGSPVALLELARLLSVRLGRSFAIVIMNSEAILKGTESNPLNVMLSTTDSLVREWGPHRFRALIGGSSGGLNALAVAAQTFQQNPIPVWMLDTYKPFGRATRFVRAIVRPPVRTILRSATIAKTFGTHSRLKGDRRGAQQGSSPSSQIQHQAAKELNMLPLPAVHGPVHLIQATATAREQMLLLNRATNGFDPAYFRAGTVTRLDALHDELASRLANEVAAIIAQAVVTPG
ncbi:MAG: AMP-binding protein [Gemmatimonas sp.]